MGRKKLVVGNWKLNGELSLVASMKTKFQASGLSKVETVVCPPFPYLSSFADGDLIVGAQDISAHANGAFTGEVSAAQLREFSCRYAIVGHSERREYHTETDAVVAAKAKAAIAEGITPIVCFGEPLEVREAGDHIAHVVKQVKYVVESLADDANQMVLAYEPIWAIGTGKTATPEQAQEVHSEIRTMLATHNSELAENIQILYGGSVKADNAEQLFSKPDVDGGLIGGASLKPDDFLAICTAAEKVSIS
ncbi:MAG: triose-phosphate isomerase [Aestuariibacter sp.]